MQQNNKISFNLAVIAAIMLMLTACDQFGKKNLSLDNEDLIARKSNFDKNKFIEQTKQRSAEEYQYGPKVQENGIGEDDNRYRKIINKEENFDFDQVSETEKNSFKVSVNAENMDIRDFAALLSAVTNVNFLVSDEVNGVVSAKLKDVYWTSLLDTVLNTKKLAKYVDNKSNIIRIHDQTTISQLEDFEQKRKESVQKSLILKKASQPLYTEIFKLFYTKPDQIKAQIDSLLATKAAGTESIRNINPEITADARKNLVIVKARKEDMDLVAKLISELDTRTQQIYIEAFIVEVDDNFEKAFGTRLGLLNSAQNAAVSGILGETPETPLELDSVGTALSNATTTNSLTDLSASGANSGIGILAGGTTTSLKLELTALQTEGLSKIVSNPRIFTLDNQEAVIFQGTEIPYTNTTSQEGATTQFKEAGLKLTVTPQIIGDGNLQLNIQVNKDSPNSSQANPPISKSEIKTNLVTKDGEIVVMGGIYTESDNKANDQVPGFGDIPVIGNLFKRKDKKEEKKELIIFIAPKII